MSEYVSSESDEESEYVSLRLEKFLKTFPTPLHYKLLKCYDEFWVFWSQDNDHHEIQQQQQQQQQHEGFQINNNNNNNNDSVSADVDTQRMISDKIKHALCGVFDTYAGGTYIIQFWAPTVMTISSGRRLLSTFGQPFAVNRPSKKLSKYRLRCMDYHFDDNDPAMIISEAPTATAFLNRLPEVFSFEKLKGASPLVDSALECGLTFSFMLPVCFPSHTPSSSCVGVVELSTNFVWADDLYIELIRLLKEVGLGVFQIQERIPYQMINGLKSARDEIEDALKIICLSYKTLLAQVWISFEDDYHVPFSSSLEGTRKKQMLYLKLTGYLNDSVLDNFGWRSVCYYRLCDLFHLGREGDIVTKTLEDYKPRVCDDDDLIRGFLISGDTRLVICLNSIRTENFCYAFEFIWGDYPDYDVKLVEELLLKLKVLLPSLKLASGVELGDELDLIKVRDSTATETKFLKIFQGKRLSPIPEVLEEGRRIPVPMVVDCIAPLEAKYKTTPIPLSREVIERQFGNTEAATNLKGVVSGDEEESPDVENSTWSENILQGNILLPVPEALERGKKPMVENYMASSPMKYKTAPILLSQEAIEHQYGNTMLKAAKNLNVSISTLKRKCKAFGISEWQGPAKRKVNDSSNQSDLNEKYDGAILDPSAINQDENTLTIKAEYLDDMIKFHLCISKATFITVVEEIGKKFKLTRGTYKLKYLDEDKDWILLASDQDMSVCINSSRNLGRIVVRLRVLSSTQPISA